MSLASTALPPSAQDAVVHAWSSSRHWFFLAYFEHRCRISTGNLHGHS
jgi:hypothetical protein